MHDGFGIKTCVLSKSDGHSAKLLDGGAELMHVAAGTDRAPLPKNITDMWDMLLAEGAEIGVATADSTSTLDLVPTTPRPVW